MTPIKIRNYDEWAASIRNFADWLEGSGVPGACDIDCCIERRGNFLIIEGKSIQGSGVSVPMGQAIMLDAFARLPQFTVWLIGEGPKGGKQQVQWTPGIGQKARGPRWVPTDWMRSLTTAQLQELVRDWWGD